MNFTKYLIYFTFCAGLRCDFQPPRNLNKTNTPYLISIIFRGDSGHTIDDYELCRIEQLFSYKRKNPNGCPTRATFLFNKPIKNTSVKESDKCILNSLSNYGHEIGISITDRYDDEKKEELRNSFLNGTTEEFKVKIQQAIDYLTNSTKIQRENIKGSFGFDWPQSIDIPLTYSQAVFNKLGDNSYDTTLKDKESQKNLVKWPSYNTLTNLMEIYTPSYASRKKDTKEYIPCFELGATHCHPVETADEIRNLLWKDFISRDSENANRAPFIINIPLYAIADYHHVIIAIDQFLDMTLNLGDDVWVVTASQMIDWIKSNETELDRLREFEGFGCKDINKTDKLNCSLVEKRCSDFTGLLKCKDKKDKSAEEYPNPDFAKIDGKILLLVQTIVLILIFIIFTVKEKDA